MRRYATPTRMGTAHERLQERALRRQRCWRPAGDVVIIVGIGISAVQDAKYAGAPRIIAVDPSR